MYTVDASVWVNAFDQRESGHATSRRLLEVLRSLELPIVVPNLLCVEIAGAISRTRNNPAQAGEFASALTQLPNVTLLALDEKQAEQAQRLAAQHGLRGADAVYASVALHADSTLVSLDQEHLTRLTDTVRTCAPAEALTEIEVLIADKPTADSEVEADSSEAEAQSENTDS